MKVYKILMIVTASATISALTAFLSKGHFSTDIVQYNMIYAGVVSLFALSILTHIVTQVKEEAK